MNLSFAKARVFPNIAITIAGTVDMLNEVYYLDHYGWTDAHILRGENWHRFNQLCFGDPCEPFAPCLQGDVERYFDEYPNVDDLWNHDPYLMWRRMYWASDSMMHRLKAWDPNWFVKPDDPETVSWLADIIQFLWDVITYCTGTKWILDEVTEWVVEATKRDPCKLMSDYPYESRQAKYEWWNAYVELSNARMGAILQDAERCYRRFLGLAKTPMVGAAGRKLRARLIRRAAMQHDIRPPTPLYRHEAFRSLRLKRPEKIDIEPGTLAAAMPDRAPAARVAPIVAGSAVATAAAAALAWYASS